MPTHFIRFRKAWDCQDAANLAGPARRLELPLSDADARLLPGRARLSRTFGCPPLVWGRDTLAIRIELVPGLRSLRLNDRLMPLPDPIPDMFEIPLEAPLTRNRLVLEVELDAPPPGSPDTDRRPGDGWGLIALVIDSRK